MVIDIKFYERIHYNKMFNDLKYTFIINTIITFATSILVIGSINIILYYEKAVTIQKAIINTFLPCVIALIITSIVVFICYKQNRRFYNDKR